ncbi:hypothetical protein LINPERPRIM_LOCUS11044 [Linum perenne]
MRRWERGIQPLEIAENQCPEWIIFKNVPPDVISIEGVSWLCSLIGKPLRKFIREGLNVKACIIRDKAIPCPEKLSIEMEDDEIVSIEVVQVKPREYNVVRKRVWRVVQDQRVPIKEPLKQAVPIILDSEGVARETSKNDKAGTETPMGNEKENAEVPSAPQTSKKKSKKKMKKAQKRLGSAMDSVVGEGGSQPAALPEDDGNTSNVPEPLLKGEGSPTIAIISQEAESSPVSGLQGDENESGKVTSEEEHYEIPHGRKKATFDEFLQFSRPAKQKLKQSSGVQTRFKHNRR